MNSEDRMNAELDAEGTLQQILNQFLELSPEWRTQVIEALVSWKEAPPQCSSRNQPQSPLVKERTLFILRSAIAESNRSGNGEKRDEL